MHRPAQPRAFGRTVVLLYCLAGFAWGGGIAVVILMLRGDRLSPLPAALFILAGTLTISAVVVWSTGRREDGTATREIPAVVIGAAHRRLTGYVNMRANGSDPTVYGGLQSVDQLPTSADVPEGAAAQIFEMARRIGRQDVISGDTRS